MQYQLAHDGAYRVYLTEFGIDRTYIGPPFAFPRAAIAYSDQLDGQCAPEHPEIVPDSAATFTGALWPSESLPTTRSADEATRDATSALGAPRRLVRSPDARPFQRGRG